MVDLRELTADRHEVVERFWQFFLHDLSEFRDSHPDEHGAFKRRHLEPYLVADPDRVAYVVDGPTGPIGFAFVSGLTDTLRRFDQFFIVRSQRRAGVARAAAEATVRAHPGRWEVAFQNENPTAARFWRRLAAEVGSNLAERSQPVPDKPHIPDDVILAFDVETVVAIDESYCLEGPPRPDDAAAHRRFALDPDAARFFGWTVEAARSQPDSYYDGVIERFRRDWDEGRAFVFTIRDRSGRAAVGSVEVRLDDANVSYVVAPELRGRGLATRAVEALLRWCVDAVALDHVDLTCHVENVGSRRVAEKCGFVLVSREGDELRFRRGL